MCLEKLDLKKTKKARKSDQKVIGYKLLTPNKKSMYINFLWKEGLNISNRKDPDLTEKEISEDRVDYGFHFFEKEPEICRHPCASSSHSNLDPCMYPFRCPHGRNKTVRLEIDPEDLVAFGEWSSYKSFVANKATLKENGNEDKKRDDAEI